MNKAYASADRARELLAASAIRGGLAVDVVDGLMNEIEDAERAYCVEVCRLHATLLSAMPTCAEAVAGVAVALTNTGRRPKAFTRT